MASQAPCLIAHIITELAMTALSLWLSWLRSPREAGAERDIENMLADVRLETQTKREKLRDISADLPVARRRGGGL
ncbi:uncharacterized protein LTR77_000982 [Saxophila tyrrhenica]|uniref:Uncharacterized protein n=1 Tax=Saxophila tyrrhenica TaxID=1690608 RepID=A0AAV9PSN8_9PEZI|nr:hypothetical protein LTR77_000982 [Saxophila tyrrhenica]